MAQQKWPDYMWVVRHGQSAGNVARELAESQGLHLIDIVERDIDVPLSQLGEQQAIALGKWFGELPADERPTVVLSSPYLRACSTAHRILEAAAIAPGDVHFEADERLREKEFGIIDRLTTFGIAHKYPELKAQRAHVGKFYFRPPGGESWCDVILRLRNVLDTITREFCRERVLIVGHQVIVNCFRYLLEQLSERQILEIDRQADVPNCGVTSYRYDALAGKFGRMMPDLINYVVPLQEEGTPVTAEPDAPAAPKP